MFSEGAPPYPSFPFSDPVSRLAPITLVALATVSVLPATGRAAPYVPGEVIVHGGGMARPTSGPRVVATRRGETVRAAIRRLERRPGVRAVPNYIARIADVAQPDDPGRSGRPGGWASLQWNFVGPASVNAPQAWVNAASAGRAGGRGVVVAVLDTGVAYRSRLGYPKSPDFAGTRFRRGWDFVGDDPWPLDIRTCHSGRDERGRRYVIDGAWGHGTHVAGTIAEATDNEVGVTGLAYRATIMPVRVLDSCGRGRAARIAQGVRWAVDHGAQLINLSFEFDQTRAADIPDVLSALRYARRKGVLAVGAAGNRDPPYVSARVAYPARARTVLSVGATTDNACLAEYSKRGAGLDLVAPGGGYDARIRGDARCNGTLGERGIYQMTFVGGARRRFGLPGYFLGTSMATPHVTGAAALVIASGVIGAHPSPDALTRRLESTARRLGPHSYYGYGLVDAGRATSSG
jgi:serine protease